MSGHIVALEDRTVKHLFRIFLGSAVASFFLLSLLVADLLIGSDAFILIGLFTVPFVALGAFFFLFGLSVSIYMAFRILGRKEGSSQMKDEPSEINQKFGEQED